MLATGSGGSLTAAHVCALLHESRAGKISKAVTPFELIGSGIEAHQLGVFFMSAGGRNVDIIRAFKTMVMREPERIIVLCSDGKSPLARLARNYNFVDLVDVELPSGKDGFLATNSLLAFSVLACRAWGEAFAKESSLPISLSSLTDGADTDDFGLEKLRAASMGLWQKDSFSVLYGRQTKPAAVDLESKFSEAALGSVQLADYRNFAHGRHHWLAKRPDSTAVVAFITDEDRDLAQKTLRLLPPDVPVLQIDVPFNDERALISSLVQVLQLTGIAGENRGIDPGRPGVPDFGRKIYHLRSFQTKNGFKEKLSSFETVAIERKTGTTIGILSKQNELAFWRKSLKSFAGGLCETKFQGVVFDFDGTLCDRRERFEGIGKIIKQSIMRFLENGIFTGIATGRGKSVKTDFQSKIPKSFWSQILIGTYNGGEMTWLDEQHDSETLPDTEDGLKILLQIFQTDAHLEKLFSCEARAKQLSLFPRENRSAFEILQIVREIIETAKISDLSVLYSSHSIDVLAGGVSKVNTVWKLKERIGGSPNVVCIGDRGRYPGNDYQLLAEPFSLSVDESSLRPETCWNLAPGGFRGVQGAVHYLNAAIFEDNSFGFDYKKLVGGKDSG